ncbi:hypothetical protein [Streptomyces sp. NPDC005046]
MRFGVVLALRDLSGKLDHQALAGEELGRCLMGVVVLQQAGGVPHLVVPDRCRPPQHGAVMVLVEGLLQIGAPGGESLHIPSGGFTVYAPDVVLGPDPRIDSVRQVVGKERRKDGHSSSGSSPTSG